MDAAKVELMRALGRLVRGLSILVWGLPLTLFLYIETARTNWFGFLDDSAFVPALAGSVGLYYGLRQFHDFQKQERIWRQALHRAEFFALLNTGLSPFLFWWHRFPAIPLYNTCLSVLALSVLIFLMQINEVLRRLCAMLPDEGLRAETNAFAEVNVGLFLVLFAGISLYLALANVQAVPPLVNHMFSGENPRGLWFVLFVGLMPLALTVELLWKIKEVIFRSIIEAEH